ncbi:hypothetical protein ACO2Q8_08290 [Larkinella sp. VNQ87]|uniref:hypothetical protein n=1 Tax=Larkinella sp. VNQ87 TaxID=3400921 RepID=UPI003C0597BC
MNEEQDYEIQKQLEQQFRQRKRPPRPQTGAETEKLYHQLFEALSDELPGGLPYGFSAKVIRHIQRQNVICWERRAYGLIALCLLLVPLAALAMQAVFRPDDLSKTLRALNSVKGLVLFGLLLMGLIQWADRRFVKKKKSLFP